MFLWIWTIAFGPVGLMLGLTWIQAYSLCQKEKRWIMITPLWMFMVSQYTKDGEKIRLKSLVYMILALIFAWLFLSELGG